MTFKTWTHPKINNLRVYLNGAGGGLKIFAERLNEDSYRVSGWYDDPTCLPQQYRNSGKCWAINIFMDALDKADAPREVVDSFDALVDFATKAEGGAA
jgi:hypothetical protein|tara:strand:- start:294 stop:587 length:294 start_codon:yes stop_codon:yes gene_type:complete